MSLSSFSAATYSQGLRGANPLYTHTQNGTPIKPGSRLLKDTQGNITLAQKTPAEVVGEKVVRPLIDTLYYVSQQIFGSPAPATTPTPDTAPQNLIPVRVSRKLTTSVANVVGEIIALPFETVPKGFLECNGQQINKDDYPELFEVLRIKYGLGTDINTFKIPDYRGYFLRGWDHGAGVDPNAATRSNRGDGTTGDSVGTKQGDLFLSHQHTVPRDNLTPSGIDRIGGGQESGGTPNNDGSSSGGYDFKTLVNSDGGGKETRPKNANVMFVIRAFPATTEAPTELNVIQICDTNHANCFQPAQITTALAVIENLEGRLSTAESKISTIDSGYKTADLNLKSDIDVQKNSISGIDTAYKKSDSDIQKQVSDNKKTLDSVQSETRENSQDIAQLQEQYRQLNEKVDQVVPENAEKLSENQQKQDASLQSAFDWIYGLLAGVILNAVGFTYMNQKIQNQQTTIQNLTLTITHPDQNQSHSARSNYEMVPTATIVETGKNSNQI